jgi:hypothetical protein
MVAYPQIQLGLELGVNTVYGTGIKNEHFNLSNKLNYSPWNIGYFISMTKGKSQFTVGYRGGALDGTYKVNQNGATRLYVDIYYESIVNRYYISYLHKWRKFKIGGNFSSFQIENFGFGSSRSNRGQGNTSAYRTTDFNAPSKWYFIPAFELAYEYKIKKKYPIIASLELPLWRFTGYNIYYESTINYGQPQSINIVPKFYAAFFNIRIPVFSIGKGWNYFSANPTRKNKEYNGSECPK